MNRETQLLVFYDISDDRKRQEIHRFLKDYGLNSQKSLFEIQCDRASKKEIIRFLKQQEPTGEDESILIYEICRRCLSKSKTLVNCAGLDFKSYQLI